MYVYLFIVQLLDNADNVGKYIKTITSGINKIQSHLYLNFRYK